MSVEAILLGTAQDGGVPQAGCDCPHCRAAWADPRRRQLVACLGLVDHARGQSWLIDATPDLREQVYTLDYLAPNCPLAGIVLTHAHVGHYSGLIHLSREAWGPQAMAVYVSPRMARFLGENAPWDNLITWGHVQLHTILPTGRLQLSPDLQLVPVPVPHRDELSDTLAFVVRGPTRQLFYCPDIDRWDRWEHDLRRFVDKIDIALLDGTFFDLEELPHRDIGQIPHPPVTDTAERLAGVETQVRLIHLNHTNPLLEPGPERAWLKERGIGIGRVGERWRLDQ